MFQRLRLAKESPRMYIMQRMWASLRSLTRAHSILPGEDDGPSTEGEHGDGEVDSERYATMVYCRKINALMISAATTGSRCPKGKGSIGRLRRLLTSLTSSSIREYQRPRVVHGLESLLRVLRHLRQGRRASRLHLPPTNGTQAMYFHHCHVNERHLGPRYQTRTRKFL